MVSDGEDEGEGGEEAMEEELKTRTESGTEEIFSVDSESGESHEQVNVAVAMGGAKHI